MMRRTGREARREAASGYMFIAPAMLVIVTFFVLPILMAVLLSFFKVKLLGGMQFRFVGLDNFVRTLDDDRLWIAIANTVEYVSVVVPVQTVLALLLAVALNSGIRGKKLLRVVYFLPTVTSSAVLTLIFMWLFNANGLVNGVLEAIGFAGRNWIGDPQVALWVIIIMNIWSTAPFYMVIYLAALQDIPDVLYEAAEIDGASWWQKFRHITVPMLKPVTFFVAVTGVIGTFQLFDQAYIFSSGDGGPDHSTLTVVLLIYQYAFKSLDMGYAGTLAFLLAVLIMLVTLVQRMLFREEKWN